MNKRFRPLNPLESTRYQKILILKSKPHIIATSLDPRFKLKIFD